MKDLKTDTQYIVSEFDRRFSTIDAKVISTFLDEYGDDLGSFHEEQNYDGPHVSTLNPKSVTDKVIK